MIETNHIADGPQSLSKSTRFAVWGAAAIVLLIPAIGMQFSSEVNWGPGDFAIVGIMLLALCTAIELAFAFGRTRAMRLGAIGLSLFVFLAIWAELAVGILD